MIDGLVNLRILTVSVPHVSLVIIVILGSLVILVSLFVLIRIFRLVIILNGGTQLTLCCLGKLVSLLWIGSLLMHSIHASRRRQYNMSTVTNSLTPTLTPNMSIRYNQDTHSCTDTPPNHTCRTTQSTEAGGRRAGGKSKK